MRLIAKARGRSTIIMTTARPSHMRAADRVVVLQDGIIVAQGKPDQIVPRPHGAECQGRRMITRPYSKLGATR